MSILRRDMNIPVGQVFEDKKGVEWLIYRRAQNTEEIILSVVTIKEPRRYVLDLSSEILVKKLFKNEIKLTRMIQADCSIKNTSKHLIFEFTHYKLKEEL